VKTLTINICLVGPLNSGKTTFIHHSIPEKDRKAPVIPTVGVDHYSHHYNGYDLRIKDSSGDPKYQILSPSYNRQTDFMCIFIDPFSINFFKELAEVKELLDLNTQNKPKCGYIVVLTKSDLLIKSNGLNFDFRSHHISQVLSEYLTFPPVAISTLNNRHFNVFDRIIEISAFPARFHADLLKLKTKILNRFIKPNQSREASIDRLLLLKNSTAAEIKNKILEEMRDIREPDSSGKLKYGNFFRFHVRDYKHSELYQFLALNYRKIDNRVNLDNECAPAISRRVVSI
jgi:GTPase SAR1 family protein